jgi:cell division protein FtsZ
MNNMFGLEMNQLAKIKVVGIGGGGCNAVNRMIDSGLKGVDFIVANTDLQVLNDSLAPIKLQLGSELTDGLGAGANPEIGREAALESKAEIEEALKGADMVFVTCGMGGGTGTGASPIVAEVAQELGALTVAVVTTPFGFEGAKRRAFASEGLQELRPNVDSIIVVSNETLLQMFGNVPMSDAFNKANDILMQSVRAITSLVSDKALINLDFADIKNIMIDKGTAMIGMGRGFGASKAKDASNAAISSPLLGSTLKGAKNAIVNITGGSTMTLQDANEAVELVREAAGDNINIIFGVSIDDNTTLSEKEDDYMCVTVIATEFSNTNHSRIQIEPSFQSLLEPKQKEEVPVIKETPKPITQEEFEDDNDGIDLEFQLPSFLKRR